jgi:anti-anti-sigma factor
MLDADIERQEENCILHLKGELSVNNIPVLEKKVQQAYSSPVKHLIFDMEGVDFIDSRGSNALLQMSLGQDGGLVLVSLDTNVAAVLERLMIKDKFKIYRSVSESLRRLK